MARLVFVFLLLAQILVLHTIAHNTDGYKLNVDDQNGADGPVSSAAEPSSESQVAEAPEIRRLGKHHFYDESVAGGGVIIGGLATAVFVAVFCYIRVTRKRDARH